MRVDGFELDPELDLYFERRVPVSPRALFKAWTTPEHLMRWFCPAPWRTTACRVDLRPGGEFFTVMEGPEGERHENVGCYLVVDQDRRLIWTDALAPGFRPSGKPFMTGGIVLEPDGEGGTRYVAFARHADPEACTSHRDMGFEHGWGAVLDQLVAILQAENA